MDRPNFAFYRNLSLKANLTILEEFISVVLYVLGRCSGLDGVI
jgi:hypothetical protein